ncbi:MAG TPA: aquaporin [Nitrospirales bacterium]|jgi:MIP family channel proteins|nr:aquaporin [Nitrospirales bacterium]
MEKALKPCVAEAVATFAFCFVGAASIINNAGLLGIAIAHGCMMAVLVSALGHISGGHNNPAVTFGVWVGGKISGQKAVLYVVFQLIGAVVAGLMLRMVFPEATWQAAKLGTPMLSPGVSMGAGILVETVLTFFLVLVVYGTAIDDRGTWKAIAGFGIGLTIMCDILMGGPLTGASMNPARTFGPALAGGYWADHIVYWIGPLLGGGLAGLFYTKFLIKS